MTRNDPPVIDVHSHLMPAGLYDAAARGLPWFGLEVGLDAGRINWRAGSETRRMPWGDAWSDPIARLASMDQAGVDIELLSLNPAMFGYSNPASIAITVAAGANDGIAEFAAADVGRLKGLAHLPLQDPEAAVRELERAVTELGMVGAGIGTNVAGLDLDDASLFRVFEAAADLDCLVFIHPADDRFPTTSHPHYLQNLVGHPVETTVAMASLIFGRVLERLPKLRVCFAHGGGYGCTALGRFDHGFRVRPECQDLLTAPSDFATQIYVDTVTHSHAGVRFLVDTLGPTQVVLGTDTPADMGQVDPVAWLQGPGLEAGVVERILASNARALLGTHAEQSPADA